MKLLDKMSKSKKKQVPLPTRPPPPTVDMIMKDMEMAPKDDVAFTTFKTGEIGDTDLEADIIAAAYDKPSSSGVQSKSENGLEEEGNVTNTVNTVYKQVSQFLENCDSLKKAPGTLNEQCRQMESIAGDLEKTVSALQDEAISSLGTS